ncbi:hypothetical protein UFOVP965_96 [uncultured Caudovirales phage]|uniref:Uncharacterized protein n=1 Tax=uncultured Caudovirales phage TaxID=2100421 RepID=A0A6J5Q702_9CAUD|nr:hypothetical protein UFOVP965_96 [uncultured Caudovirales phage]CAB4179873.1 hypothetical protein UFOVP1035_92 [uncultured Caudovirales phage]CAB4188688.1 hypothetical protein UFOVP1181_51 [uncultured Caudovirales phage]
MSTINQSEKALIGEALDNVTRVNYALLIKAEVLALIEALQDTGIQDTEVSTENALNRARTVLDYLTYVQDSPNEVPNA